MTAEQGAATETLTRKGRVSTAQFALLLLTVVYVANFANRTALYVLLPDIQAEFKLADWQVGLLGGTAFAVFYTMAGLPIARIADRGRRVTIICVCMALWSTMTMACGLTASAFQLLLARVGVAVGEAGCTPAAHGMINRFFSADRRATALGVYAAGSSAGAFLGLYVGGLVAAEYGWRAAFLIIGAPGVLIAAFVGLSLREPPPRQEVESAPTGTLMEILKLLGSRPTFRWVVVAAAFAALAGDGVSVWTPTLLNRSHGVSIAEAGRWMAFAQLIAGCGGMALGGYLSDRAARRGVKWRLWTPGLVMLAGAPFALGVLYLDTPTGIVTCLFATTFATTFFAGPTFSAVHSLVGSRMRATATALVLVIVTLIGTGLGPLVLGIASDLLRQAHGADSLRLSLLLAVASYLISAFAFIRAGQHLERDARSAPL